MICCKVRKKLVGGLRHSHRNRKRGLHIYDRLSVNTGHHILSRIDLLDRSILLDYSYDRINEILLKLIRDTVSGQLFFHTIQNTCQYLSHWRYFL